MHYPTEFLLVGFGDGLALGVRSFAQNVDDDLFVSTESFHGSSPRKRKIVTLQLEFHTIMLS